MAFPLAAPLIAAGASLVGSGANAMAQGKMNRQTRRFNEKMWHMQTDKDHSNWVMQNERDDFLWNRQNDMNLELWNMENEYNSPRAMMQRFQEAGLNPHLIYGQSNMGGSISTATPESTKPQGAPSASWNPRAPQFDMENGILAFNAFRESSARVDNLEQMTENAKQDLTLKVLDSVAKDLGNKSAAFDFSQKQKLADIYIDAKKEELRKITTETDLMLRADERAAIKQSSDLREATERILGMRDQRMTNEIERNLKRVQKALAEQNLEWNEVNPVRLIPSIISEPIKDVKKTFNLGYDFLKNKFK